MENISSSYTFDDLLILPNASDVLPKEVNLKTKLTRDITLNIPLMSAAMDTVTENKMAIAIAELGGIGVIHKNMSIESQAEQVKKVKKFESGIIKDPITVTANTSVKELLTLAKKYKISGFPVIEGEALLGIVTHRDWRFESNLNKTVLDIMTSKEKLVTALETDSRDHIINLLQKHRLEKVLLVDANFKLKGLVTVKDIQKSIDSPNASKDSQGRLMSAAAVGIGVDTMLRAEALIAAGVDVLVVDTAHGHSKKVIDTVKSLKKSYSSSNLQIIAGNIATEDAALALADAGADAVKVGIGPGSICTTRIVTGVGVPQITAIIEATRALKSQGIPVIADGGIRYSGDIAKAVVAGASCIMVGSMLAGTEEAPGETVLYQGRSYKVYRGMGSLGAMASKNSSKDRYFQADEEDTYKLVPEGVEGRVPYKGPANQVVYQLMGGLRSSMGYVGAKDINEMQTKAKFVKISPASFKESHVHDVSITKEPPNYIVY